MKDVYQVLIVEDDPMVAMINEQYLRRSRRFNVAGKCGDGRSALEFLAKTPVDLVIMDVFMPQLSGIETLQAIREHGYPVDVIMVTAANDRATLEDALRLGAVDYLVKPFALDRFQSALEKFITHAEALKNVDVLSQQNIDFIIANARKGADAAEAQHPKGIQEKTLTLIMDYMKHRRQKADRRRHCRGGRALRRHGAALYELSRRDR